MDLEEVERTLLLPHIHNQTRLVIDFTPLLASERESYDSDIVQARTPSLPLVKELMDWADDSAGDGYQDFGIESKRFVGSLAFFYSFNNIA